MAFTQDELQSLNTILEQKLLTQRRDLELIFDQRLQALRRDLEQRLATVKSDLLHTMSLRLNDQHARTREVLLQKFEAQHAHLIESVEQSLEAQQQQQQQRLEASIERSLAAQLLAIEQIIHQRLPSPIQSAEFFSEYTVEGQPQFDAIEVQTEIPWEELATLVDHALEERMFALQEAVLTALKDLEQVLLKQLQAMHASSSPDSASLSPDTSAGAQASQDSTKNIERLEHLIEAMQVAMTANSSLISNRLYHHQQLPLERAHPAQHTTAQQSSTWQGLDYQHAQSSVTEPSDTDE
ncbi:hypothetical protein [Dictyobacter formicarum]|nr:hypothetical protein [Dictyobacter formicarum]